MANSPGPAASTPTTSTLISSKNEPLCTAQATASRRSRRAFGWVIASSGEPNLVPDLVLTSQMTSVLPSRATMSISPWRQRQFRASTVRPASARKLAASCSPCCPSASLAFIPASPPAPKLPEDDDQRYRRMAGQADSDRTHHAVRNERRTAHHDHDSCFFASLKNEMYYLQVFPGRARARFAFAEYIEVFCTVYGCTPPL